MENKYICMFNARFKALLTNIKQKYPENIDFGTKVDLVNDNIKSLKNRIPISLFIDYIIPNEIICDNLVKVPTKDNIDFWDSFNLKDYNEAVNENSSNPVFDQIKEIFKISDYDTKLYVLKEFYNLKKICIKFDDL